MASVTSLEEILIVFGNPPVKSRPAHIHIFLFDLRDGRADLDLDIFRSPVSDRQGCIFS